MARLVGRLVAEYQRRRAPALGGRVTTLSVGDLLIPTAHDLARQLALLVHGGRKEVDGG